VSFPEQEVEVSFSDFLNEADTYYARKTRLHDRKSQSILIFDLKQIVFNQAIPEAIFELKKPDDFSSMFQLRQRKTTSLPHHKNVSFVLKYPVKTSICSILDY
jgi:hypothetical protein